MPDAVAGRTYAVPDLHGRFDLLESALTAIEAHGADAASRTLVFLGDYIDRGPQSAQVLARLAAGASPGWRWTCLKGNHEEMMGIALRDPSQLDWWLENGGGTTIESFGGDRAAVADALAWIDALDLVHVDAHRVYVHGGIDPACSLDAQMERTLLWKRYGRDDDQGHGDRHVVHGHHPNIDGPLRLRNRTDLDTLAYRTGRLVVGVFEDGTPGGPADLLEIRAAA